MTTTELHALRSAQLKALGSIRFHQLAFGDWDRIFCLCNQCGVSLDTRRLSDKALEEIQTLAGRYLEQVK